MDIYQFNLHKHSKQQILSNYSVADIPIFVLYNDFALYLKLVLHDFKYYIGTKSATFK